jgi:hypothetical protein
MAQANPKVDVDSDDCMAMDPTAPAARELVGKLLTEAAVTVGPKNKFVAHLAFALQNPIPHWVWFDLV